MFPPQTDVISSTAEGVNNSVNNNETESTSDLDESIVQVISSRGYKVSSLEKCAIAVVTSMVTSFVIGIILGCISRRPRDHHRRFTLRLNPRTDLITRLDS